MGDRTGIEWTDATWNPLRGCSRVSQGCVNCYAETMAARFSGSGLPFEGTIDDKGRWNGEIRLVPDKLDEPLRWQRPRRVFVNSMSDLFHDNVPDDYIAAVFGVMAGAQSHTFQILTKRPERALRWIGWLEAKTAAAAIVFPFDDHAWRRGHLLSAAAIRNGVSPTMGVSPSAAAVWPLPNVWIGVSVEDQRTADERIPLLLQCSAAVRWVSAEPLLGPINFEHIGNALFNRSAAVRSQMRAACLNHDQADAMIAHSELDWVVCGGESGRGARPMHPDWARNLRDQCAAAGVPFLFKQWGDWCDVGDAVELAEQGIPRPSTDRIVNLAGGHGFHGDAPRRMRRVGKRRAGRLLDGVLHDGYPGTPK